MIAVLRHHDVKTDIKTYWLAVVGEVLGARIPPTQISIRTRFPLQLMRRTRSGLTSLFIYFTASALLQFGFIYDVEEFAEEADLLWKCFATSRSFVRSNQVAMATEMYTDRFLSQCNRQLLKKDWKNWNRTYFESFLSLKRHWTKQQQQNQRPDGSKEEWFLWREQENKYIYYTCICSVCIYSLD